MRHLFTTTALAIAAMFTPSPGHAQEGHDHDAHAADAPATTAPDERIGDPWPLDTCVVSGMKLGSMGDAIIHLHEGREVRFCCAGCTGAFERDPDSFLGKADATIIEQQKAFYPLDYCIVDTPEALSEDESENSYHVIGNRLFIFCCPPCENAVRAEPAKYFATLDKAVADKQRADYPLETCIVSGHGLDAMGEPVEIVAANQLIRLCCKTCIGMFEEQPAAFLQKLKDARQGAGTASAHPMHQGTAHGMHEAPGAHGTHNH